jgi:ADP-ribose pyrophosphatase YjhB (NUDIX family)
MEEGEFYVNVEGAIYRGDQWLMIVRSMEEDHAPGTLAMPGGTVSYLDDSSSVLESALRRECLEETGVSIGESIRYVSSNHFQSDIGEKVLNIVFLAEYAEGEAAVKNLDEVSETSWLTLKEIEGHTMTPPWILASMQKAEKLRLAI